MNEKEQEERMRKWDELRLAEVGEAVVFTNQEIVELAYIVMDVIEPLEKSHTKLVFDDANCYAHCFYLLRELLKKVNPEYLTGPHERVKKFYEIERELSNSWDRLYWMTKEGGLWQPTLYIR
jgi:hypothetical protein